MNFRWHTEFNRDISEAIIPYSAGTRLRAARSTRLFIWLMWFSLPAMLMSARVGMAEQETRVRGLRGTWCGRVAADAESGQVFQPRQDRSERPGTVVTPLDAGHWIRYYTACSLVANAFLLSPLQEAKIQELYSLLDMSPQQLRESENGGVYARVFEIEH